MVLLRWLVVLAVVLWVVRIVWRYMQPTPDHQSKGDRNFRQGSKSDNLLRCSRCDILISQELALLLDGQSYCSIKCRDQSRDS